MEELQVWKYDTPRSHYSKLKICQTCGKEYLPTSSKQKYCTICGKAARSVRRSLAGKSTHEIRTVTKDGEPWFIVKDVCDVLSQNYSYASMATRNLPDNMKGFTTVQTAGGPQRMLIISKRGRDVIVSKSVKPRAIEFCHAIHIETVMTRQEASSLLTITKAFVELQMKIQYRCGPYRIDLYIPKYKLAVECDENDHIAYLGQDEATRQTFIESALGCTFIRFNPDAKEFNIGTVINRMLMQMRMQDALQGATL